MADSLRGDGLARAHKALRALEEDPRRLERTRSRFSKSPPSYRSDQSHNSTLSNSPSPPDPEQQLRETQRFRLTREHQASLPSRQFAAQMSEELDRICKGTVPVPIGVDFRQLAHNRVKELWVEQGIWKDNWTLFMGGSWKHEEPLVDIDLEAEEEEEEGEEDEAEPGPAEPAEPAPAPAAIIGGDSASNAPNERHQQKDPFYLYRLLGIEPPKQQLELSVPAPVPRDKNAIFGSIQTFPHPQPPQKTESPQQIARRQRRAERRANLEREREASRPFRQFVFQVSKESEQLHRENPKHEGEATTTTITAEDADINTRAYQNVKDIWINRLIWNKKWGILPGRTWKHEEPIEWLSADLPSAEANLAQPNDSNDAVEGHPHSPGIYPRGEIDNPSQPGQLALSAPGGSTEPPPEPTTPPRRRGKRAPNTSTLGPVHPSKVSKPSAIKRGRPRRLPKLSEGEPSAAGRALLPQPDTTNEPPKTFSTPPRRSNRLRTAVEPTAADDTSGTAPTSLTKSASKSRTATNNSKPTSSSKPRGIVKKQSSTTTTVPKRQKRIPK